MNCKNSLGHYFKENVYIYEHTNPDSMENNNYILPVLNLELNQCRLRYS